MQLNDSREDGPQQKAYLVSIQMKLHVNVNSQGILLSIATNLNNSEVCHLGVLNLNIKKPSKSTLLVCNMPE